MSWWVSEARVRCRTRVGECADWLWYCQVPIFRITFAMVSTTPSPAVSSTPSDAAEHRRRLLDAMAVVVARKGYADATIADLAAEARVSRRTFYEHFQTKAQCLIALY